MEKYVSRFQMVMAAPKGFDVVKLGPNDWGMYTRDKWMNHFGTPLMARGTEEEIRGLVAELGEDNDRP